MLKDWKHRVNKEFSSFSSAENTMRVVCRSPTIKYDCYLSVTCDERDRTNTQYITYPCLIVEVLSPGTEAYDRGSKFRMYRQNPNLQEYVLVDANSISVELFRRTNENNWQMIDYQIGDTVELKSVNLTFAFEQVYEEITFTK